MQQDRLYKVSNISDDLSVSTTTVYKHIKKLKERLTNFKIKEKGVSFFNQRGYELIVSSIKETLPKTDYKHLSTGLEEGLNTRLKGLEQAIMLLVESNNKLTEQNQKLAKTVQSQSKKLNLIQLRLEVSKAKPIKVWQPPVKTSKQHSFFKQIWYELTQPELLRSK